MSNKIFHITKYLNDQYNTDCDKNKLKDFIKFLYKDVDPDFFEQSVIDLLKKAEDIYRFIFNKKTRNKLNVEISKEYSSFLVKIVADEMFFVADSVTSELIINNFDILNCIMTLIPVSRNDNGDVESFDGTKYEVVVYVESKNIPNDKDLEIIRERISVILQSIQYITEDKEKMLDALDGANKKVASYKNKNIFSDAQINEFVKFLDWLSQDNFIFMAYIEYSFDGSEKDVRVQRNFDTLLGVARIEKDVTTIRGLHMLPDEIQSLLFKKSILNISKSERISNIYKRQHMDGIGIQILDDDNNVVGERRFLGVFSPNAHCQDVLQIPIIRKKIKDVLVKLKNKHLQTHHTFSEIRSILLSFPIEELLQYDVGYLTEACFSILYNRRNPKLCLLLSIDKLQRFINCLILVPRKKMHNKVVDIVTKILEEQLNAKVLNCYVGYTFEMVRIQIEFKTIPGNIPKINHAKIEKMLKNAILQWSDAFAILITDIFKKKNDSEHMVNKYRGIFPSGYQDRFLPVQAIQDIEIIENLLHSSFKYETNIYKSEKSDLCELKIFSLEKADISFIFSIIENMGLVIVSHNYYSIKSITIQNVWLYYFILKKPEKSAELSILKDNMQNALQKILIKEIDNDTFNKLIVFAGFCWHEVLLFRAIVSYLKQIKFVYASEYIQSVLISYIEITKLLLSLFKARFDPGTPNKENLVKKISQLLKKEFDLVNSVSEYTVFKILYDIIFAILRTNFYQENSRIQHYVSFKLKSDAINIMPKPKPFVEIFVFSDDMEGVHLRGGRIARGGLRWSDRIEDYRTEVLGLMRAQVTKNTVIIPTGAKGGFVIKNGSSSNVVSVYKKFLCGLLDITDNIVDGKIVYPINVVRYDSDDPYLVVAADKGTATFSDYANEMSAKYNFWMGDAFASGGSAGYDHKKMAITARGGWISVVHHLSCMSINIMQQTFTVVGIGDMSGDVFGNGMILSDKIKLIAAFDHRNIFIDPNPDPVKSFAERKRLFLKSKSSWEDYDSSLISAGGGVFSRKGKLINISPEIGSALGTKRPRCAPDELISIILKAPVDLMWNGGIGTYIKSCHETNEMVSDKINDMCRVNGIEVRARVVGEGGNLGVTQLGRIEYAKRGGKINTDFIDNSAGVSCSDHEVNIKIVLYAAIKNKKINLEQRNKLLNKMNDSVADLVLRDNFTQNIAVSFEELQSVSNIESDVFLMQKLDDEGYLDIEFESLPSKKDVANLIANNLGLTRPEICILLSYLKLAIYDKLISSKLSEDKYLQKYLIDYFPKEMQDDFREEILNHPLKKEIITTYVTNNMVNYGGFTFFLAVAESTNADYYQVALAYIIIKDMYNIDSVFDKIISNFYSINDSIKLILIKDLQIFIEDSTSWILRHYDNIEIDSIVKSYNKHIQSILASIPEMIDDSLLKYFNKKRTNLLNKNVNPELLSELTTLWYGGYALDIAKIYILYSGKKSIKTIGKLYFSIDSMFQLAWIREVIDKLDVKSYWKKIIVKMISHQMRDKKIELVCSLIETIEEKDLIIKKTIQDWMLKNKQKVDKYLNYINEIKNDSQVDVDMLDIAIKRFKLL